MFVRCRYANRQAAGLVSREGWAVIDDTGGPSVDPSSTWNGAGGWIQPNAYTDDYRDLMLFAYGTDYKSALGDFVKLSGPTVLMDYEA
jgi:hypothetical protein